jgi:predicted ATP-dependent endonuclease of OLD family
MIIKKLFVQNYRCFGEDPAVIHFAESGMMSFVGSNNAGKSTAMKALGILLGDKWPSGQFSEDDFYNRDFQKEIQIACEFKTPITMVVSKSGDQKSVKGLSLKVGYLETKTGGFSTDVVYQLIDRINDFEAGDWTIACYGTSDKEVYVSQDIRNNLPIAITIPLIKLQSEQPTNKWGILGRMLQKIENTFSKDTVKKEEFEKSIHEASNLLTEPQEFKQMVSDIERFWNDIKPNNLSGTALEFLDFDPWHYYRQFRLAITKNGCPVPLDTLGEGVQRLAVIALYRTYLNTHGRNQQAILLVEEPESYLHPQARSVVYTALRDAIISTDNVEGQIIFTTHSSDFLDCSHFEEIAIFSETPTGSIVRQVSQSKMKEHTAALLDITETDLTNPGIYYRLVEVDSHGLKDALFGNKAVIVEGATDYEFIKAFGGTDRKQLSVVVAGGKENIGAIYSFLTAFGIPSLICADRDSDNATNEQIAKLLNHEAINRIAEDGTENIDSSKVDTTAEGKLFLKRNLMIFSKDLEGYLGKTIPSYSQLCENLKTEFKIRKSKPKLMFAVGLCVQNSTPVTLTEEQIGEFNKVKQTIDDFLLQEMKKPELIY